MDLSSRREDKGRRLNEKNVESMDQTGDPTTGTYNYPLPGWCQNLGVLACDQILNCVLRKLKADCLTAEAFRIGKSESGVARVVSGISSTSSRQFRTSSGVLQKGAKRAPESRLKWKHWRSEDYPFAICYA